MLYVLTFIQFSGWFPHPMPKTAKIHIWWSKNSTELVLSIEEKEKKCVWLIFGLEKPLGIGKVH